MFKKLRSKIREHEAAWEAHQVSDYGKIYFPRICAILAKITVEYFDVTVA